MPLDCAVSVNSLYFWKDTLQGLKEVNRVLKQGACFCTSIYTKAWFERSKVNMKGYRFFERDEYINLGLQAGFSEVRFLDIKKGDSFVIIFQKP